MGLGSALRKERMAAAKTCACINLSIDFLTHPGQQLFTMANRDKGRALKKYGARTSSSCDGLEGIHSSIIENHEHCKQAPYGHEITALRHTSTCNTISLSPHTCTLLARLHFKVDCNVQAISRLDTARAPPQPEERERVFVDVQPHSAERENITFRPPPG